MDSLKALAIIKSESELILDFGKYQIRTVNGGKVFMLADYGTNGYDIFYPDNAVDNEKIIKNFHKFTFDLTLI